MKMLLAMLLACYKSGTMVLVVFVLAVALRISETIEILGICANVHQNYAYPGIVCRVVVLFTIFQPNFDYSTHEKLGIGISSRS